MLAEVADEELGGLTMTGVVPKLSGTPGRIHWAGRKVGADTRRVLRELGGLSAAEVERLEGEGVVACGPARSGEGE